MNLDNLQQKLIAAARANSPGDQVPYAFEKRIMARLAQGAHLDMLGAWSNALWRAALSCAGIVLITAAVTLWNGSSPTTETDLSHEFETAVFANAGSTDEAW